MLLNILRTIFIIIIVAVLISTLSLPQISGETGRVNFYAILWSGLGLALIAFLIDVLTPKKSLSALAGVFFGLLVGILLSWGLAKIADLIVEIYNIRLLDEAMQAIKWMMGICVCYLVIGVVMRTKDDVRFVIPYVEFDKQTKGTRPVVLDTSAIIDGRIADLARSKVFDVPLVVPRFVLNELQLIADSSDKLKRNRGRRGLDILKELLSNHAIEVEIDDTVIPDDEDTKGVDQKLVVFAKNCNGRLATTDYNLSKVAQVRQVEVLNINDLANSLKAIVLPGEGLNVRVIKEGEGPSQGVGYLEDGTMVVVEDASNKIGRDILISITSSLQTSAGKMIFGKFEGYAQKVENNR